MDSETKKMKCVVCHEENAQYYDDLDSLFENNKTTPYCKRHYENKLNYLETKCRICISKHRECSC